MSDQDVRHTLYRRGFKDGIYACLTFEMIALAGCIVVGLVKIVWN